MSALDRQEGGNHYKNYTIQPVEFIHVNNLSYLQGNVIKYVTRYKDKNGVEDLKKAMHYIQIMIDYETRRKSETGNEVRPARKEADRHL
jgi:hypothetical protein